MKIEDIIKKTIDIHMHIGPEAIPRKYTMDKLIKAEKGKIGGFVLKNHFYPTQPFINEVTNTSGLRLFGGVVLNNALGGLNTEAIYASAILTDKPIVVWLPTINADNFLQQSDFEIAPEWVKKENFIARKVQDIKPVRITKNGKLTAKILEVLKVVKESKAVLATGHISWQESIGVIDKALQMGIKKIVVTHPVYQKIAMPIEIQKQLTEKGCFIEQSYSMISIDNIEIKKIAKQIKFVGTQSVILSSDVGQTFSTSPSAALYRFAKLLQNEGVTEDELFMMLVSNPKTLMSLD